MNVDWILNTEIVSKRLSSLNIDEKYSLGSFLISVESIVEFSIINDPMPYHTNPNFSGNEIFTSICASGLQLLSACIQLFHKSNFIDDKVIGGYKLTELYWLEPVYQSEKVDVKVALSHLIYTDKYTVAELKFTAMKNQIMCLKFKLSLIFENNL